MTKLRAPDTIEKALVHVANALPRGFDEMAEETNRPAHRVRAWADPAKREQIPVADALLLDKACQRAGGGTPIAEYYLGRLKAAGALAPADSDCLARHAARVVRECGEAGAALFEAAQPGSTPAQRVEARREVDEALEVLKRAVPMLVGHDAFEKMCVGSGHQSTGPPH
jgi:hypothetical protein